MRILIVRNRVVYEIETVNSGFLPFLSFSFTQLAIIVIRVEAPLTFLAA